MEVTVKNSTDNYTICVESDENGAFWGKFALFSKKKLRKVTKRVKR